MNVPPNPQRYEHIEANKLIQTIRTTHNSTWDHSSYMKEEYLVVVVVVIDAPPIPLKDLDPIKANKLQTITTTLGSTSRPKMK